MARKSSKRSLAARKGWDTRKKLARKRSAAARKGWVTRKANAEAAWRERFKAVAPKLETFSGTSKRFVTKYGPPVIRERPTVERAPTRREALIDDALEIVVIERVGKRRVGDGETRATGWRYYGGDWTGLGDFNSLVSYYHTLAPGERFMWILELVTIETGGGHEGATGWSTPPESDLGRATVTAKSFAEAVLSQTLERYKVVTGILQVWLAVFREAEAPQRRKRAP